MAAFSLERKKLCNAKFMKQMYPCVEEDFKEYMQNAKDVALNSA
jgi:hypothetical protein